MKSISTIDELFQAEGQVEEKVQDVVNTTNTQVNHPLQVVEDQQNDSDGEKLLSVEEMFKEITFEDYFESVDASVRLSNSILAEIAEGQFPYANIADYYYGDQDHKDKIDKTRSFGKKSRKELDDGLEELAKDEDRLRMIASPITDLYQDINIDAVSAAFFQITLHDFAEIAHLQVRTRNSITANSEQVGGYFSTVDDYYSAPESQQRILLRVPNLGKGSKTDLDQAIDNLVSDRDRLVSFVNHAKQQGIDVGEIPAGEQQELDVNLLLGVDERFRQLLSERAHDVLTLRLIEGLTLEQIGEKYDVSRERIRQIEAKALKKLRKALLAEISVFEKRVSSLLSETKGIAEYEKILRDLPDIDEVSFTILLNLLDEKKRSRIMLKKGILWQGDLYDKKAEIYRQIDEEFLLNSWPVRIPSMELRLPEIPKILIERRLKSQFKAIINDDMVQSASKLTIGQQARFVLRTLGRPSHHSETYKIMRELFNTKARPHALEAELGRSEDILIVDRGTYTLYETFWLNEDDILRIRDDSFRYLSDEGEYVRAYLIFDALFKGRKFSGREINPYIVLGVVQDDPQRFTTKPGLVIGLSHFGATYQISSVIRAIVQEHGPIHINKIASLLPESRRVEKETISTFLLSDAGLVRQKSGTYDTVERVLGSKEKMDSLLADIRYQLQQQELKSDVIFENIVKKRHPKLTKYALRVLLRSHFTKNKETGCFYAG